ncbi:DUF721 domain-containing protein [Negadavirga shengliensis]|uniref:DUF721 domain-containing protein n=1 Tax=Negadavirga shengliensis TaxID=1389218 RepID=A0ABV9T1E7_9BACT
MKNLPKDAYRKNQASPLKEVFEELLQTYRLKERFSEKTLIHHWGDLMGKTVLDRTTHLYIKEKVLYARISSGPLKKELMLHKSKVLCLIDERFGEGIIHDIVFL